MLDEAFLKKFASFLVTFYNHKARRKVEKAGYKISSVYKLPKTVLTGFGFTNEEINSIYYDYKIIATEEIEKGEKSGILIIDTENDNYPSLLKEIYDFPEFLYVKGDLSCLNVENKLAIVGSRNNNSYGRDVLNTIIPDLCRGGLITVSGMANGIDSLAHKITLNNGGKTIGVNAGGLLHLYPAGNSSLFPQIEQNGCLISEFPLDVIPRPFYFPIRNRIISGISKAVLVVQATIKSGSLITARVALEQNRDVFTIPGHIYSPLSFGPNYLIKQGAKLIENSADILEEFGISLEKQKPVNIILTKKEKNLLDLIGDSGVKSVDYFVEKSVFNVPEVISILMGLVLKGVLIEMEQGYRKVIDG